MCEKQNIALNYIWLVKKYVLNVAKLFFSHWAIPENIHTQPRTASMF